MESKLHQSMMSEGTMTSIDPSPSSGSPSLRRVIQPSSQRTPDTLPTRSAALGPGGRRPRNLRQLLSCVRAWMLVLPVDALLLATPLLWSPQQWRAHVVMTGLGLVLITGGTRYRARLHLSTL